MFGASSEPASVMEFGFNRPATGVEVVVFLCLFDTPNVLYLMILWRTTQFP